MKRANHHHRPLNKLTNSELLMVIINMLLMIMVLLLGGGGEHQVNGQKLRATPNRSLLIKERATQMINSKCIISMKGLDCPDAANDQMAKTSLLRSMSNTNQQQQLELLVVAGVGYSRMDHTIKPQILESSSFSRISSEETVTRTMNSAEDYYGMMYPKDGSTVFNGLFSHGATASDLIFSQFFAGNFFMMNSQKQVFTHQVELTDIKIKSEFQQVIDILPNEMDESLYRLVIDLFGDSIATKIKYGGVVDMTVSVRSCFSDPSMMKYLENQLHLTIDSQTDTKSIPNGYMRYHKVDSLDIVGGDPQIAAIKQRIASFERNPVPIRMELIPIWRAFPPGVKQENMKKVYNKYMEVNAKSVADQINDLNRRRNQEYLKEQPFYIYSTDSNGLIGKFTNDVQIAAGTQLTLDKVIKRTDFVGVPQNKKLNYLSFLMTPIINRNSDGSFFFEFSLSTCEIKLNVPTDICKKETGLPAAYYVKSKTVSNKCERMTLKNLGSDVSIGDLIVCSGCQPFISANFKEVSCECPYVK